VPLVVFDALGMLDTLYATIPNRTDRLSGASC
jgi:hypothetical protein